MGKTATAAYCASASPPGDISLPQSQWEKPELPPECLTHSAPLELEAHPLQLELEREQSAAIGTGSEACHAPVIEGNQRRVTSGVRIDAAHVDGDSHNDSAFVSDPEQNRRSNTVCVPGGWVS